MANKIFILFNGKKYYSNPKTGYYENKIFADGKRKTFRLHRVVYEFYSGKEIPKGYHVHHKDENKDNNDFSNLVLLSHSEHAKLHGKKPLKFGKDLKCKKQIKEVEKCAKSGIAQKREEIGTQNIKKNTLPNFILLKYVPIAEEDLIPQTTTESRQYVDGVEISTLKENYAGKPKKRVYNITVRAGCYYANNILVSNCDAASMAHSIWRYAGGGQ